jgi:hypothetical protein
MDTNLSSISNFDLFRLVLEKFGITIKDENDITGAWLVVEKMQKPDWAWGIESVYIKGKLMWFVTFWGDVDGELITDANAEAETLPLAICKAALKAME